MGKGGGGSSAPAAPDPAKTAAAQTATNKETAYWNAVLNNVNQITPYGNLTYAQTGGGKQYNQAAYDKALADYNASGSSDGGKNPYNPVTQAQKYQGWQENNSSGSSGKKGKAPVLSDYLIGDSPPSFTSTIQLSPEQQKLYETQTGQQQQLLDLGGQQIGRIDQAISSPYSYAGLPSAPNQQDINALSQHGQDAIMARLDPQFAHDEEALRTRLINQGIGQGSEAYAKEFDQFNQAKNDARMQAILQGQNYGAAEQNQMLGLRNQAIGEYDTQRNAPLNEYIGLTSGTQVTNPQFSTKQYQGTNPVDYANLVNNQYQSQLGQYNAKTAQQNNTQNSLFGLGGSLLGAAGSAGGFGKLFAGFLSDRSAKENIVRIGETPRGLGVYEFNYIGDDSPQTGVMADEVEEIIPDAVYIKDGLKHVNYAAVR